MGIPALPFSKLDKTAGLPKPKGYPNELITIGDQLRAWRLDNNLLQKDVAKLLGVCEDSITGWEKRGKTPGKRQMKKIVTMLGNT